MPTARPMPRVVALAATSLLLYACGSGGDADTAEPNGEVIDVVALDNTFRPETVEVSAGTEVRWDNRGRNVHNVVPSDQSTDWGVDAEAFGPGAEYTELFDTPGEYPYYCSLHGTADAGMIGTIVVLPADG